MGRICPNCRRDTNGVLKRFAAHSSNQQNNERFVGETARIKMTGKHEKRANIMAIASNDFTVTTAKRADEEAEDGVNPCPFEKKKKIRLRGQKKAHHLLGTVHSKLIEFGRVATELGGDNFGKKRVSISKALKSQDESLMQKRSDEFADGMIKKLDVAPTQNVRMRNTGADITPRTRGKMSYSGIRKAQEPALVMELQYRHIVPYKIGKKQIFPTPDFQRPLQGSALQGGASFEKLTFTEKKLLLAADEERFWRIECRDKDPDVTPNIADFDIKTFRILDTEKVNFDITNNGD
jgi:hypothetical protein